MGSRTTKNQRDSVTGTTTFLTSSVNHSLGERSSSFFPALQGDSNPDKLKLLLFHFKAMKREIYMFIEPNSKADDSWSWKQISQSHHTVYTYAWHGNVQMEIMLLIRRIPDSHWWKKLRRFSGLTHFLDQKTGPTEGKWLVQSGHSIRKGRVAPAGLVLPTQGPSLPSTPPQLHCPLGMAALKSTFTTPVNQHPQQKWAWKQHSLCSCGHCPASQSLTPVTIWV